MSVDHNEAPVPASNACTVASTSTTNSLPPATTGVAASRARLVPPLIVAAQARTGVSASASCPIDLAALPPDCVQLSLAAAGGSTTVTSAIVVSETSAFSEARMMSALTTGPIPAPSAGPFTAAITALLHSRMQFETSRLRRRWR